MAVVIIQIHRMFIVPAQIQISGIKVDIQKVMEHPWSLIIKQTIMKLIGIISQLKTIIITQTELQDQE